MISSRGFSRSSGKSKSTYSTPVYRPPPKPLTADELKNRIEDSIETAKFSKQWFYILLASAIVSAIILACVDQLVPHTYEEDAIINNTKTKIKKTSNNWLYPIVIFSIILALCCWFMMITWTTYKDEDALVPLYQSKLNSLLAAAPSA